MYGNTFDEEDQMFALSQSNHQEFMIQEDDTLEVDSGMKLWSPDTCDLPPIDDEIYRDSSLLSINSINLDSHSEDSKDSELYQTDDVSEDLIQLPTLGE